jgi:hypothetical protein
LLIYYCPCDIPGFLRGKLYADFTDSLGYDRSLALLARTLNLHDGVGGNLYDPYAERFGRHSGLMSRPIQWFCINCGAGPTPSYNDYVCTGVPHVETVHGWQRNDAGLPPVAVK